MSCDDTEFIWVGDRQPDPAFGYNPETPPRESLVRWFARKFAGIISVYSATFAGIGLANTNFLQTRQAHDGVVIIGNGPDTAFLAATALLTVSFLLMIVATAYGDLR